MIYLYLFTAGALLISTLANRRKTLKALQVAKSRFLKILPAFVTMMILFSITITLIPQEVVAKLIGH